MVICSTRLVPAPPIIMTLLPTGQEAAARVTPSPKDALQGERAMTNEKILEARLAAVENAVAELKHRLANVPPAPNWLEQVIGSFKDDPAFQEVLDFGRALRSSDRPLDDGEEQA